MSTGRELPPQGTGAVGAADLRVPHVRNKGKRESFGPKTMMTRCKIPHTDMEVSRIAYGCADLVGWTRDPLSEDDVVKAERAIRAAVESGITLFDLADLYGFGKAEEAFGKVLHQSPGLRQRIFIQSKCGQVFPEGWRDFNDPIRVDSSREHIVTSVDGILKRLGTDYLDILLLHAPDGLAPPEEIARAFDELHRSGKVRFFGVSNYAAQGIALLQRYVRHPLVVNQIPIGLANPFPIADGLDFTLQISRTQQETEAGRGISLARGSTAVGTLDYCRLHDIQVQAYSPMPRELVNPPRDPTPALKHAIEVLQTVAQNQDAAPSAVALAWLLHHPAGILPIIGSTNPNHIIENCTATRVTLSHDEWYRLFAAAAGI
jgi:predicted oxidoreductase